MGLIFSRFYDKPSTRDTLERIEQELQNIEERRWDKIKREQFIVQILSFIPITILIGTVCILIYPSDSSWRDKLLLCVPIIIVNLILWVCRRSVQWYSRWSLDNEEARLRKLQKEKKKILEMVCETESYRVAAELLEKYDPKQLRRRENRNQERPTSPLNTTLTKFTASPSRPASSQQQQQQQQQALNQSQQLQGHMSFLNQSLSFPVQTQQPSALPVPTAPPPTPALKTASKKSQLNQTIRSPHNTSISTAPATQVAASSVQGRPVRPILSKDRTLFERMVDWVVADGPENRFALICRYCYGHNGMSLAEEFETINFRCCYCYNLNTATHKRQVLDQLQPEREKSGLKDSTDAKVSEKAESEKEQEVKLVDAVKEDVGAEESEAQDSSGKEQENINEEEGHKELVTKEPTDDKGD